MLNLVLSSHAFLKQWRPRAAIKHDFAYSIDNVDSVFRLEMADVELKSFSGLATDD